nr:MAG TPA: hypothetical protein [Caudoviricetes sp.]
MAKSLIGSVTVDIISPPNWLPYCDNHYCFYI